MLSYIEVFFSYINKGLGKILFYPLPFVQFPLILGLMVFGGLFFTIRYGFINVKLFKHSFDVLRGKYDDPNHVGEISHFQALTSALSATVGLGNIAGVALAIQLGGPGAVFWMWAVAFFGMSMKLSSCTFSQLYREVSEDGVVLGGPMVYLKEAYAKKNWPKVGLFLGGFSAVCTILGALGGGNLFQANQTYELLANQFPYLSDKPLLVGFFLVIIVGIVVWGGIKRIAEVTEKLVPSMLMIYVAICLYVIFTHYPLVPSLFQQIFIEAFKPDAIYAGGFMGVLIQGVQRGSFSNEAGVGTAAIAHAAAKTDQPIREGAVAMLGPFFDTIVICTMTALTILITGVHLREDLAGMGAQMTAEAFMTAGSFMPYLLTIATAIFAYSTIISYSYYADRAVRFLFGKKWLKPFQVLFLLFVFIAPTLSLKEVIGFSDLMLLSMAMPNIIGMTFLSGEIKVLIDQYWKQYKSKEF